MTDEERAAEYASHVSTAGRVLVDLYIGDREFTRVTDIVQAAFLDGLRASRHVEDGPEEWTRQRIEAELKSDVPNITIEDGLWLLKRCRPTACVKCGRYPATICQGNYDIMEEAWVTAQKELDRLRAANPQEVGMEKVQNIVVPSLLAALEVGSGARPTQKHVCNICHKDCGGCTSPAYQCAWLVEHNHGNV